MSVEEQMAAALRTFVVEAQDLLNEMEAGLLALEAGHGTGDATHEAVNALFRAVHTIKGSSGLFGLDAVVEFAHVVENVLDAVRAGEVTVTPALVGALLPCRDHLGVLVGAVADGRTTATTDERATGESLLSALRAVAHPAAPAPGIDDIGSGSAPEPEVVDSGPGPQAPVADLVVLSLRFGPDCLRTGMDPLSFLRFLATMGEVVTVTCVEGLLPPVEGFDPETCYLAFLVALRTASSRQALEEVFDFVREDSDIRVVLPADGREALTELADSYGDHAGTVRGWLAALPAPGSPTATSAEAPDVPAAAETATAQVVVTPAAASAAPVPAPRTTWEAGTDNRTIRVDADRLDHLIDSVGELVIAGAGARLRAEAAGDEALLTALGDVMRLVEEVRDGALQLRMVPVGTTFSRFQRIVRDVGASLGKEVGLVVRGGDTEVDKSLAEQIADPLTHLVRNALDHGIEPVEVRRARGKPARGTLELNAFHDSGSIVIEVSDDGGGIDADRVLARAVERGLLPVGATPAEHEVLDLIFEPGFSTAERVSDLSGRGVGMDVVRRNVTALRGTIEVDSRPGQGTTFRIRLPLTLAIIDGFLVGVGDATFVVPLDRVVECVELPPGDLTRDCMDLRGEVLPFIRLRSHFAVGGERSRRENVVVVEYAGTRTGLVVDALGGEFQTVIKPLGRLFGHVQGVGGATILGNGDVALIIDVPVLVRDAGRQSVAAVV